MHPTSTSPFALPSLGCGSVDQAHSAASFWNEEEPVCYGELVRKLGHTCQGAEERALSDPALRPPHSQDNVWVVLEKGIWYERPTMVLALGLGPSGISAAAGRRAGLTPSVMLSRSRFTTARHPRKTQLLSLLCRGKHQNVLLQRSCGTGSLKC